MISMTVPQYRRRECSYKGWLTKLSRQEADVLFVLLVRGLRPSSTRLLIDFVWHNDPDGGALSAAVNGISRLIAILRAKLPGAIKGRSQFGYYIEATQHG